MTEVVEDDTSVLKILVEAKHKVKLDGYSAAGLVSSV